MTIDRDTETPRARRSDALPTPRIVGRRPAVRPATDADAPAPLAAEAPAADAPDEDAPRPRTRRGTRGGRGRGGSSSSTAATTTISSAEPEAEPETAPPAPTPARRTTRSAPAPVEIDTGSLTEAFRGVQTALHDLEQRMARLGGAAAGRLRRCPEPDVRHRPPSAATWASCSTCSRRGVTRPRDGICTGLGPRRPDRARQQFVAPFVPYEYRIVTKPLKRFADGSIKGNFDVEMAVDMLTMADRLDVICSRVGRRRLRARRRGGPEQRRPRRGGGVRRQHVARDARDRRLHRGWGDRRPPPLESSTIEVERTT